MFITTQMRSVFQKELPHSKMNNTIFSVGTILTQMLFYTLIAKYYIAMHICIFVAFGHIFNLRSSNLVSHTNGRYRSII